MTRTTSTRPWLKASKDLTPDMVSIALVSRTEPFQWTHEPLAQIEAQLAQALRAIEPGQTLGFLVPDPELGSGRFSGQAWEHHGQRLRHRSYRNWIDLAETLHCRMVTPLPAQGPFVNMRFQKLNPSPDSPSLNGETIQERYGEQSSFFAIEKLEEPCFLSDLRCAYARVSAQHCDRVLDLGVHRGDELLPLQELWDQDPNATRTCVGVDHCASALSHARARFDPARFNFVCDDLRNYETWELDPFDLLISIGTLQCRGLRGKSLFPQILRRFLRKGGAVILGFPYLRYIDGEIRQGGKIRNFSQAEHALVFKDLMFYRKLLLRRSERVTITGRYYLFLTAWSGSRRNM